MLIGSGGLRTSDKESFDQFFYEGNFVFRAILSIELERHNVHDRDFNARNYKTLASIVIAGSIVMLGRNEIVSIC